MAGYNFSRHLKCPWCHEGEILADGRAKISVSIQCPKCRKIFVGSLDSLITERSKACKRLGRNK